MSKFGQGIRLGFDKETGEVLRWMGKNGHLLLVGPTGEGKTRDVLLAAVAEAMESCSIILVEPKGALCSMLYRRAAELGQVDILNPFAEDLPISLPSSSSYNPMATLDPEKRGYTTGCERIATLVCDEGTNVTNENSAHFRDRAKELISGVIMEVGESPEYEDE